MFDVTINTKNALQSKLGQALISFKKGIYK